MGQITPFPGPSNAVSRDDAAEAVRTLLHWAGDVPEREGLQDTPRRVLDAFGEHFSGYGRDPADVLSVAFNETAGYTAPVTVRNIDFVSHCEHHMAPFFGQVDISYIPHGAVVGLSKLARLVDIFAKRLQIQERMTVQIAEAIQTHLNPQGVAVRMTARHTCLTHRGANKPSAAMTTQHMIGVYETDQALRQTFFAV